MKWLLRERKATYLAVVGVLLALVHAPASAMMRDLGPTAASAARATRSRGPVSAPVTVVVYSDFECPFCAQLVPALDGLRQRRAGDVRIEFRHFPLDMHARAHLAHEAAEFAAMQGKFWEFHNRLFANRKAMDRASLLAHATSVGLDREALDRALGTNALSAAVDADIADGEARGVSATPTLFINGALHTGALSVAQLEALVDGAMGRPVSVPVTDNDVIDPRRVLGASGGKVTVDWFVDLASPLVGRALALADQVVARYPRDLQLVFRHRPSGAYAEASRLHAAVEQAADRAAFWVAVREAASAPTSRPLLAAEGRATSPPVPSGVAADIARAERLNILGAPAFVVGDRRFDGLPSLSVLSAAIDAALGDR